MPTLAAYFGDSITSFSLESEGKIEFVKFPYVYSKAAFGNQCTKAQFYRFLIETILKEKKTSLGSCEVLVSGFLEPPEFSFGPKSSVGIVDIISSVEGFYPVFVTGSSLITKDIISSFSYCKSKSFSDKESDYFSNLAIFPQLVPTKVSLRSNLDEDIAKRVPGGISIDPSVPVVFTGDRFGQNFLNKELNYVLMLDLFKSLGIYTLYLDDNNKVALTHLLDGDVFPHLECVGTFVNTKGPVECLINTLVGEDQFLEVGKDEIYILPLSFETQARVSIKNVELGNTEIKVSGGSLGLVFDTREEKGSIYGNVKLFNNLIKQLDRVLANK